MAFDIDISIEGFREFERDLERFLEDDIFMRSYGDRMTETLRTNPRWPVDTGFSLNNFEYEVRGESVAITNLADYAVYVEQNTNAVRDQLEARLPIIASEQADLVVKRLK